MSKEAERKKIVEAISISTTAEEIEEILEKEGFEITHSAEENKSKKKANI